MPTAALQANLGQILKLEVPIVVRLGERTLPVSGVIGMVPGSIIELPKNADCELDLLVNNKPVGCGLAVKVGENFGLRLTYVGDVRARIDALGPAPSAKKDETPDDDAAAAMAEALLAGQQ
jgi:flagellar motor switch protein FliN/FliY